MCPYTRHMDAALPQSATASWIASLDAIDKPGSLPSTKTSPRRSLDSQRATFVDLWYLWFLGRHWSMFHEKITWGIYGNLRCWPFLMILQILHVHFPYELIHIFKKYTFYDEETTVCLVTFLDHLEQIQGCKMKGETLGNCGPRCPIRHAFVLPQHRPSLNHYAFCAFWEGSSIYDLVF